MANLKLTSKLTFNETTYELWNFGPNKYHLFIDGNPTTWYLDFDNKHEFNFFKLVDRFKTEYSLPSFNGEITLTLFNHIITKINSTKR